MVKDNWISLKDTMREDNHVKLMSMLFNVDSEALIASTPKQCQTIQVN